MKSIRLLPKSLTLPSCHHFSARFKSNEFQKLEEIEFLDDGSPSIGDLVSLTKGFFAGQCVQVGVKLGVFDVFEGYEPMNCHEICKEAGIENEERGFRWFRGLCAIGVLQDHGNREFSLTDSGRLLRRDVSPPIWRLLLHQGNDKVLSSHTSDPLITLLSSPPEYEFRSTAYKIQNGLTTWENFLVDEDAVNNFNGAMEVMTYLKKKDLENLLANFDWDDVTSLCDIGGGTGLFAGHILGLEGNEGVVATVVDIPQETDNEYELLDHERLSFIGGDMFDLEDGGNIPKECDVYTIKNVLLDWYDEDCIKILKNVFNSAKSGSRLMICESILPDLVTQASPDSQAIFLDLHMLTIVGGKCRTKTEFIDIVEQSGWKFEQMIEQEQNPNFKKCLIVGTKE